MGPTCKSTTLKLPKYSSSIKDYLLSKEGEIQAQTNSKSAHEVKKKLMKTYENINEEMTKTTSPTYTEHPIIKLQSLQAL